MALPPSNAFSSARLDRPDRALRKIAIKQMAGQPLNNRELTRLASRQGVEMRYAENGNKNFGSIASAYEAAGAPLAIRNRLAAAGSALGRINAEYGENSLQGVQQLNRERLLRERELGNLSVERNKLALGDEKLRSGYLPKQLERQEELSNLQLADARMRSEYLPRDLANKAAENEERLNKARFENSVAPQKFKLEQEASAARTAATKSLIENRDVKTEGQKVANRYQPLIYESKLEQGKSRIALNNARTEGQNVGTQIKRGELANQPQKFADAHEKNLASIAKIQAQTQRAISAMSQDERDQDAYSIIAQARNSGFMSNDDFALLLELSPLLAAEFAKENEIKQFDYVGGDGKMKRATFVNGKQVREAGNGSSKTPDKTDKFIKDAVSGAGANAENPDAKKTPQQKFWRM